MTVPATAPEPRQGRIKVAQRRKPWALSLSVLLVFCGLNLQAQDAWPDLPQNNAAVEIPAQEWPRRPGPRSVRVLIHYPGGMLAGVKPDTGLMLTLHNWGGTDCVGTAAPQVLADRLNVVAICVNYLQSGKADAIEAAEPYDYGYLQALDALRALWFVRHGLQTSGTAFDDGRIYSTGGSGGGNVTLMANKLAPRTFTAVVDMCGMKRLSDDIAFNLPGGSTLNARYSNDPAEPNYLSPDEQALRFIGNPAHLETMRQLGTSTKVFIVHGVQDATCPFPDAEELVANLQAARLDVRAKFVGPDDLDGKVFTSAGHPLGNRTEIALQVAGDVLRTDGKAFVRRMTPTDFERKDEAVRYQTANGEFVISYATGYPVGRFEPRKGTP